MRHAPEEDVAEPLALALAALQLRHTDLRRHVRAAGVGADAPAHLGQPELEAEPPREGLQVRHHVVDEQVALPLLPTRHQEFEYQL